MTEAAQRPKTLASVEACLASGGVGSPVRPFARPPDRPETRENPRTNINITGKRTKTTKIYKNHRKTTKIALARSPVALGGPVSGLIPKASGKTARLAGPRIRPARVRLNFRLGRRNSGPYLFFIFSEFRTVFGDLTGSRIRLPLRSHRKRLRRGSRIRDPGSSPNAVRNSGGQSGNSNGPLPGVFGAPPMASSLHDGGNHLCSLHTSQFTCNTA